MCKQLTLGSVFDGSGGFPLGAIRAGIKPLWASEINPFAIRVTTKRLPDVSHLGDITKIDGGNIPPVDIITSGSPCQDMSVAGKRDGLDGSRSSLFYQAIRIIREMRERTDDKYPRYFVWENVPGAMSSTKGDDFRKILEEICRAKDEKLSVPMPESGRWTGAGNVVADGFSIAWRILSAEYFGVPQRRRRIYLVADFGSERASEILFERESLSGDTAPSGGEGKEAAETAGESTKEPSGENGVNFAPKMYENHSQDTRYTGPLETAPAVNATYGMGGNNQPFVVEKAPIYAVDMGGGKSSAGCFEDVSPTLTATHGGAPCICDRKDEMPKPLAYAISNKTSYSTEVSRAVDCGSGTPHCNQGGMVVLEKGASDGRQTIAYDSSGRYDWHESGIGATIKANNGGPGKGAENIVLDGYVVRRLMPLECARLQGFPDGWCDNLGTAEPTEEEISYWCGVFETYRLAMGTSGRPRNRSQIRKWLQNPHSDSAEYAMWGNGIPLPCVAFVLERLRRHHCGEI